MKTSLKILSGVAAGALMCLPVNKAEARGCSVGFGYGGWGCGYGSYYGRSYYSGYYCPPVYYYQSPVYYYPAAPVVYSAPPAVVYNTPAPSQPASRVQALSLADVKTLAKAGLSEEVILSQIRTSHSVYRLTTAEIIDLKDAGVTQRVIDFMINTATGG